MNTQLIATARDADPGGAGANRTLWRQAMTSFAPKVCQQQVLDSVEAYFKACHELPSPSIAFTATTEHREQPEAA